MTNGFRCSKRSTKGATNRPGSANIAGSRNGMAEVRLGEPPRAFTNCGIAISVERKASPAM